MDPAPRGARIALAALVALALASTPLLWMGSYAPTLLSGGDGAIYILCAESLLAGEGYTYLGEPFIIRPPGFSVLLAPLLAAFGRDWTLLTLAVWLSGIAGLAGVFAYFRPRLGTGVALAAAAVLFLNTFYLLAANQIMSDVPALAALFGCLLLERRGRQRPGLAVDLGLGVAIAAATYLRSVHLLLLPALTLARVFAFTTGRPGGTERGTWREVPRHFARRILPVIAVAVLALLPWKVRESRSAPEGVAELTKLHSYSVALLHTDPADPDSPRVGLADIAERFAERSADIAGTLGSRLVSEDPTTARTILAVLALAALVGAAIARRGTGEWFALGTLAVVSIYFGFMNRLMLPVFFLLVPAIADAAVWLLRRALRPELARGTAAALLLAWATFDYDPIESYKATMRKDYREFLETCAVLERSFPEGRTLAASRASHYCLELDRPVLSHSWPMARVGEAGTIDFLERHGVAGLVLNGARRADRRLAEALGPRLEQVGKVGPYRIERLAP